MKISDYNQTKRAVVNKVLKVDSKLRKAIAEKQVNFFEKSLSNDAADVAKKPKEKE